ncbi:MAG TPA: DUF5666 domain-containing protein [Candidatus Acidoferrum sp.]|nr:DUF5666 domain-containing protein [Candidatus Acidoferrum sp.]
MKPATERGKKRKNKLGVWTCLGIALIVLVANGCGGNAYNMPTSTPADNLPQTSAVTLTVTDAPPAGVTVLSFEVTINSAVLNPGNVQLVTNPQRIEVKQLETDSAFLSTMNAPAGTYQSITVNVTNPELTVMNNSGAAIGNCANNSVCHLEPAAAGNVTFSASPFPVVLVGGSPTGFQVDLNVANLLSNTLSVDFNASGAISVAQLPLAGQPNDDRLADVDDLLGTAENLDAADSQFTLHTMSGDFQIQANGNTQFEIEGCAADNFSCIQTGQVVEVDSEVMNGGMFIARKIEAEGSEAGDKGGDNNQGENEVEGIVFKIDDATHFEIVVLGELNATSNVALGNPVVVTLSSPQFQVDANGLNVPSALQGAFEQATDTSQLMPGQEVQIRSTSGGNTMGSPITITTNRVRLRETQFTATISGAPVPPNFTVGNLPGLFTSMGVTSILVQTSSQTNFQGGTGLGSLADQNQVSLRGLLFANGTNPPTLIVDKVRKR